MKRLLWKLKEKTDGKIIAFNISAMTMLAALLPGYCSSLNENMNKFLSQMWSVLKFVGIIFAALGVASLVKTIGSIASGEQAQPGALGRGIGMLVGGIVLFLLETILSSVTGVSTRV